MSGTSPDTEVKPYSWPARAMHWLVALLVVALFVTGKIMTERGEAGLWDATTNTLYSSHKLIGFILLWVVVLRLAYRLIAGAPPLPASIAPWQVVMSHAVHWALYGLLLVMPILGWIGVSMFGARDIFGLFYLPEIAAVDQETSKVVLGVHGTIAFVVVVLVGVHVAAALYHALILRDGVFQRMWPRKT